MGRVWGGRYSYHYLNAKPFGHIKLCPGMVAFVIKCCKPVAVQYALCPLQHIAHGLAIVGVGNFIVYGDVVPGINRGLHIVGHFRNVVAYYHLPAVRIAGRYLGPPALVKLPLQLFVTSPASSSPPISSKCLAKLTVALNTCFIALWLSLLKFEIVLWSGTRLLISHITSIFLPHSLSKPLDERTLFKYP